jgi:hypothetical protein
MPPDAVLQWLFDGDPSVRWQALRDLAGASARAVARERRRVAVEGWGARLLALQDESGQWGGGLYTPKWISTTYTLLQLRDMGLPARHPQALKACALLLDRGSYRDGGFNCWRSFKHSETCVSGMVVSMAAHFGFKDERVDRMARFLLDEQMPDGGWNCRRVHGATHGSFHTTISVLEALRLYGDGRGAHAGEARAAQVLGREFLLAHRMYRSHRTGKVADPAMTRFSFPPRWHYDVLRGLDYFQACRAPRDPRLQDAIGLVLRRRRRDGRWTLQNRHAGRVHFEMEPVGQPSRWNTLRCLRVLKWWEAGLRAGEECV